METAILQNIQHVNIYFSFYFWILEFTIEFYLLFQKIRKFYERINFPEPAENGFKYLFKMEKWYNNSFISSWFLTTSNPDHNEQRSLIWTGRCSTKRQKDINNHKLHETWNRILQFEYNLLTKWSLFIFLDKKLYWQCAFC